MIKIGGGVARMVELVSDAKKMGGYSAELGLDAL